jgi:hypothetical protein
MQEIAQGTKKMKRAAMGEKAVDPTEQVERINKLISGRMEAPNEFITYLVNQVRQVIRESDAVNKELSRHEAAAEQLRMRRSELKGAHQKYIEDIRAFDKPEPPLGKPEAALKGDNEKPDPVAPEDEPKKDKPATSEDEAPTVDGEKPQE